MSIGLPTWVRILKDTVHNYVRVDTLLRTMFCMVATRTAILVATDTGVYRSSNGGKNWFRSIQGLSDSLVLTMSIAGDTVYAVTKSGIYKSFDAGLIWSISFLNHPTFIASNNIIVAALMVDNTFWISIDAGVNWRKQSDSISARSVTGIDLVGSTNFITTSGQGVLRSDDSGKSWYQSNYHLNNISSGTMMFHNHELFVSGLQCGIFQTKDIDKHWSQNPNTNTINRFFDGMGYLFASDDQGLYRSSDYGITWYTNSIWNGPPHELIWAIGNIGTELFTGAERGWFVSEDSGNTWTLRSTNCGSGGDCWGGIFFNDTIWDGTDCNIWMSTDNAKSWSVVQAISQSTTHPINGHSIYYVVVPFGENLWYDNGKFNLTDKIPALATYGSNMLCTRDRMLVCTYSGVFETSDLGANWVADTNGIGAIQVNDIIADDDTLYITTANGVYRGVYKNLLGVSSPTLVKNKLISFPNPLSSKTTISFSNEQREFISVSIVNVLGKECAKLFSGDVDSGDHSYQWDASNFPPGMYLCLLRENGIAKEIPMMVMR